MTKNDDDGYQGITIISHDEGHGSVDMIIVDSDIEDSKKAPGDTTDAEDAKDNTRVSKLEYQGLEERLSKLENEFSDYVERTDKIIKLLEKKAALSPAERVLMIQEDS